MIFLTIDTHCTRYTFAVQIFIRLLLLATGLCLNSLVAYHKESVSSYYFFDLGVAFVSIIWHGYLLVVIREYIWDCKYIEKKMDEMNEQYGGQFRTIGEISINSNDNV